MIDKTKALLLSLIMTFALPASSETLRVYFNAGHGYDTYLNAIDEFEADNPGWDVAFERFQWPDLRTKLVADFAAGNPPDIVAEPGAWVSEFALKDLIMPMTSFIENNTDSGFPNDWQETSISKNTVNDEIYGVQIHLTCATLLYNEDLLSAAGFDAPPQNWSEFRDIAQATANGPVFGFAPNPSLPYYFPWIFQNGGDWYDVESEQMSFAQPETVEALQFLADLIHKDRAAPPPIQGADYEGPQKLFTAERAAMIITGPWDVSPIRQGNPDLNWAVAPSLTKDKQATFQGGVSLMIPKDAAHPEKAWELIERLTSVEVEVATSLQYGMTMPRKSWLENEQVANNPILSAFGECLSYSVDPALELRKSGNFSSAIEAIFQGAIDEIVYSNADAESTLLAAEEEANKLISK